MSKLASNCSLEHGGLLTVILLTLIVYELIAETIAVAIFRRTGGTRPPVPSLATPVLVSVIYDQSEQNNCFIIYTSAGYKQHTVQPLRTTNLKLKFKIYQLQFLARFNKLFLVSIKIREDGQVLSH